MDLIPDPCYNFYDHSTVGIRDHYSYIVMFYTITINSTSTFGNVHKLVIEVVYYNIPVAIANTNRSCSNCNAIEWHIELQLIIASLTDTFEVQGQIAYNIIYLICTIPWFYTCNRTVHGDVINRCN